MHYVIGFFSIFLKTTLFSPHYFLQSIMHNISIVIMHVTVSVVAMYVAVSSSNFIFLCLTGTHFSQFAFHHFYKYSSKIQILCWQKLYINQLKVIQYFCFPNRPIQGGDMLGFQKGGNLRKGGVGLEKGGMTLITNYVKLKNLVLQQQQHCSLLKHIMGQVEE